MGTNKVETKEVDTTYAYYDQPLAFTFTRYDKDGLFYAHFIDVDEEGGNVYWVIEITKELLKKAENRGICLREFVTHESIKTVEIVENTGNIQEYVMKEAEQKYKDCLPEEDTFLLDEVKK